MKKPVTCELHFVPTYLLTIHIRYPTMWKESMYSPNNMYFCITWRWLFHMQQLVEYMKNIPVITPEKIEVKIVLNMYIYHRSILWFWFFWNRIWGRIVCRLKYSHLYFTGKSIPWCENIYFADFTLGGGVSIIIIYRVSVMCEISANLGKPSIYYYYYSCARRMK